MKNLNSLRDHFKHFKVKEYPSHAGKIHSIGWNCQGTKLAAGSADKTIQIFSLESSRLTKSYSLRGHTDSVDQLSWHPFDAETFASVGPDGCVKIWDGRSKKCSNTAQLKGENINLAWYPDARYIAVGNKNDLISFLDVRNNLQVIQSEQFNFEVNEFSWAPASSGHSDMLLLTTGLGTVIIYSGKPGSMQNQMSIQAHSVNAICLDFSKNGNYFAVGSSDALVSIWDTKDFVCLRTLSRLEWPVRSLTFSHNGELIASAGEDHFIDIACVETGQQVFKLSNQSSATFVLAWHPKMYLLAHSTETKHDREQSMIRLFGMSSNGMAEVY